MGYSDMRTSPASDTNGQVVVMLLADISHASRLWGWSRIVKGPQALQGIPGLLFSKVLGSGYEGGFGLRPSPSRQGMFGLFESLQAAQDFIENSSVLQAYQDRSDEFCWALLKTWSCRGSWDGQLLDGLRRLHKSHWQMPKVANWLWVWAKHLLCGKPRSPFGTAWPT